MRAEIERADSEGTDSEGADGEGADGEGADGEEAGPGELGSGGFGHRLREGRLAAGLSQHGLAQRSGLSVRMISDLERGHTKWPYRDSLNRLADALALAAQPRAAFIAAAGRRRAGSDAGRTGRGASARSGAPRQNRPRLLPEPAPGFSGRADQLAVLSRILDQPGGTATICAIGGMAGVGKTALAVQWAHQVAAEFPDGQLYLNLRGFDPSGEPVSATEAACVFLAALGVPSSQLPATVEAQLGLYRSLLAGKRMLVVLDNARDAAHVRPLLPGSPTCRVVVTSRNQLAGLAAIEAAHPLALDVLCDAEARQLLAGRLGEARLAADPDAVEAVISSCAGLPLALSIVAARAAVAPRLPLRQIAADLAAGQAADVRAAFSWSYRQFGPAAARTFRLASLHPGPDLDPSAIAALTGMTVRQAARELEGLARVCMIQSLGPGQYTLHDLLRGYAAELTAGSESAQDRQAALGGLLDYYLSAAAMAMDAAFPAECHRRPAVSQISEHASRFPTGSAAMTWLRAQRANLVAVVVYAADHGWPQHAINLAQMLFRFLDTDAQFASFIAIYASMGKAARQTGDRVAQATSLLNLGNTSLRQGRYRQGIETTRQALALFRQTCDKTGQGRALSSLGLGNLLLGHPAPAIAHFEQALELYRGLGDHTGQARALANLGFAALRQGRYADATAHLGESLTIFHDLGDQRGQASVLANLGEVELRQGRYEQAGACLRAALDGFRQVGDRICEADTVANLGITELRQARPAQAMDRLNHALVICRLAGDVSRQALALNGLGDVLMAMDRPAEARRRYDAALALAAQAGEKYEQAKAHEGLADSYQATGARSLARRHWREALAGYAELGAPEADRIRAKLADSVT
jgi:tetratricopeptide (TPR) repeat protein/transcriptional regulator with XRE-family HTH domain